MRYPLSESQALILVKLIQNEKLLYREMRPFDMVILTQVGAIKMTNQKNANKGLIITKAGMARFVKWARKNEMVEK
tara:strand:+ start:1046 stop:1273 length:228 start_codon:yes stop_codon:yes gene_type:complete